MKGLKRCITLFFFILMLEVMNITAFAGWQSDENGSWYQYSDGSYPADKAVNFTDPNGNGLMIYVFNEQGYQVKDSWYQTSGGDWYLLRPDGRAVLTYAFSGGSWYLFDNATGRLLCTPPSFGTMERVVNESDWVNGDPTSYYNMDSKTDEYFSDRVSIFSKRYMVDKNGVIQSGFDHTIGGSASSTNNTSNAGNGEKQITSLTDEQIFAMADQYLGTAPNPRRMGIIPMVTGYRVSYWTDAGVYAVYLVRDPYSALLLGEYNSYYCESARYE